MPNRLTTASDLEPYEADEEVRLLRDKVIAVLAAVPGIELKEDVGEPGGGEAGLGVEQRCGDGDDEEDKEQHSVGELEERAHVGCRGGSVAGDGAVCGGGGEGGE